MRHRLVLNFVLILFSATVSCGRNHSKTSYVLDNELIFTKNENAVLSEKLARYDRKTTNQVMIITTPSIKPYDNIADYGTYTFNEIGIGTKEKNNGLLIVISNHLHKVRISTGYGTEKILTDSICQVIIDQVMIPEFKKGAMYTGTSNAVDTIMAWWHE